MSHFSKCLLWTCYTVQKVTAEKISDYSFQFVLNNTIGEMSFYFYGKHRKLPILDYFYYLHEPNEEQHLYMSVYPYEVPINYLGANSGEFGGVSIIYKKEEKKKIPGKGGCQEISIEEFLQCVKTTLISTLKKSDIKCMIPALSYIDIDTANLEYCNTTEDALGVNGLIYNLAQKTQVSKC